MEVIRKTPEIKTPKISLCIIMAENDTYLSTIGSALPYIDDLIIFVQANDEFFVKVHHEVELFGGLRSIIIKRPILGNADPDRNDIVKLAKNDWVLQLDDDEQIKVLDLEKFNKALQMFHVIWLPFVHYVNGEILEFMGRDVHPRLYRKGFVQWPLRLHTFPMIRGNDVVLYNEIAFVEHNRVFSNLLASHAKRRHMLDADGIKVENRFLTMTMQILEKANKLNEKDKRTYLKLVKP